MGNLTLANNPTPASGWQNPTDFGSEFAARNFQIWSVLSRLAGATPVRVMAVDPVARTVDIHPMVNQVAKTVDPVSNVITDTAVPHGTIYTCPYFQLQSGASAVVIPPTVGDIGVAIFADRDMSIVARTKDDANPGSERMFDMADGIYFGGILNGAVSQYVEFSAGGITIVSPTLVTVNAPDINMTANVHMTGNLDVSGTLTNAGKNVGATHTHSGVTVGAGNTGVPV